VSRYKRESRWRIALPAILLVGAALGLWQLVSGPSEGAAQPLSFLDKPDSFDSSETSIERRRDEVAGDLPVRSGSLGGNGLNQSHTVSEEQPRGPLSLQDWMKELERARQGEDGSWPIESVIFQISRIGSEESITVLLSLLADTTFAFPGKGESMCRALAGIDDARVYALVSALVGDMMIDGDVDGAELAGYMQLMIASGAGNGEGEALRLLGHRDKSVRIAAIEGLVGAGSEDSLLDALELTRGDRGLAAKCIEGLWGKGGARVKAALFALGVDSSASEGVRDLAIAAYGSVMTAGDVETMVQWVWASREVMSHRALFVACGVAVTDGGLSANALGPQVEGVVEDALVSGAQADRISAIHFLQRAKELRTDRVLEALRRMLHRDDVTQKERDWCLAMLEEHTR